jgi:hypothetical protein
MGAGGGGGGCGLGVDAQPDISLRAVANATHVMTRADFIAF